MVACLVRAAVAVLAALALSVPAGPCTEYPTRPITLVVPFPPGGGNDAMARIIADKLSTALGQQIVIDNRGGAGGVIGSRAAAKAAPDGYTLLLGHTGSMGINPSLYANAGYDPRKDFSAIGLIAVMPLAFWPSAVSRAKHRRPDRDGEERSRQDQYRLFTEGHRLASLRRIIQGIGWRRNKSHALQGHGAEHHRSGRRTCVGFLQHHHAGLRKYQSRYTASDRSDLGQALGQLPDMPTVAESGLPGFEAELFYGLLAPAGTPRPIVERLNKELRAALAQEEVRSRIVNDARRAAVEFAGRACRAARSRRDQMVDADPQAQTEDRLTMRCVVWRLACCRCCALPRRSCSETKSACRRRRRPRASAARLRTIPPADTEARYCRSPIGADAECCRKLVAEDRARCTELQVFLDGCRTCGVTVLFEYRDRLSAEGVVL